MCQASLPSPTDLLPSSSYLFEQNQDEKNQSEAMIQKNLSLICFALTHITPHTGLQLPHILMYKFITPGMCQFALMQMEAIGGQEVNPQAT